MPAQSHPRRAGLKRGTGRGGLTRPGEGGYDYPRGPYGATGFPGSTPAALRRVRHSQLADGRDDPQFLGVPTSDTSQLEQQWATVPRRTRQASTYRGGEPELVRNDLTAQRPKSPWRPTPGVGPPENGRAAGWDFPARKKRLSTGPERRETPIIGALTSMGQRKQVRNDYAVRYKADPLAVREYRVSPNPGKTGARLMGPSQYHPGTIVYGDPDGGPIPAMPFNPGMTPPTVTVQSRFFSAEGAQEGYAMDRPMVFTKGGLPPAQPRGADPHIRGARMSGQRYFGDLADQARIGLDSDAYGLSRRRGPRHRPVRFTMPSPRSTNFYDVPGHEGTEAPDMVFRSPVASTRAHRSRRPRRG